ncbi:hypothetical protein c7_R725 [Megavirus courdo7]|uniref:Uncharacterized protein n=1 Tax=Megavirus courdo7 TaxID=1128135 RepID=H2EBL5_9VIRU|nr:hypothetical protein c7_R725 [Megavirus courdo7]
MYLHYQIFIIKVDIVVKKQILE